ncbi:hypothetical protein EON63_01815 [archaeon]|nr:MAG: hypothetical protein EON63_01815 [archaeon]
MMKFMLLSSREALTPQIEHDACKISDEAYKREIGAFVREGKALCEAVQREQIESYEAFSAYKIGR